MYKVRECSNCKGNGYLIVRYRDYFFRKRCLVCVGSGLIKEVIEG